MESNVARSTGMSKLQKERSVFNDKHISTLQVSSSKLNNSMDLEKPTI